MADFFQLRLVSKAYNHCNLYQGLITKWTYAFLKLTVFLSIGYSTIELVRDKGPKSK